MGFDLKASLELRRPLCLLQVSKKVQNSVVAWPQHLVCFGTWGGKSGLSSKGPTKAWSGLGRGDCTPHPMRRSEPRPCVGQKLFISLFLALVMSILWLQLPRVLVCSLHIVDADISQDFLQVTLREGRKNTKYAEGIYIILLVYVN